MSSLGVASCVVARLSTSRHESTVKLTLVTTALLGAFLSRAVRVRGAAIRAVETHTTKGVRPHTLHYRRTLESTSEAAKAVAASWSRACAAQEVRDGRSEDARCREPVCHHRVAARLPHTGLLPPPPPPPPPPPGDPTEPHLPSALRAGLEGRGAHAVAPAAVARGRHGRQACEPPG